MSLVGPRPMIASIIDEIPHHTALVRQSIRPGVTGPWQVSVDGAHSLLTCLDYDETYVRSASLVLDLKLVALTAAQTIGFPKRDRGQVFAMMSHTPAGDRDGEHAVIVLPHDARVRRRPQRLLSEGQSTNAADVPRYMSSNDRHEGETPRPDPPPSVVS